MQWCGHACAHPPGLRPYWQIPVVEVLRRLHKGNLAQAWPSLLVQIQNVWQYNFQCIFSADEIYIYVYSDPMQGVDSYCIDDKHCSTMQSGSGTVALLLLQSSNVLQSINVILHWQMREHQECMRAVVCMI